MADATYDDRVLGDEFRQLNKAEKKTINPCGEALSFINLYKNRYQNVLPPNHSRVILSGKQGADYINANYVRGFQNPKAYIATQAPLLDTFADFWRLIYEQQVQLIVMLTKLTENGKHKADQYWPLQPSQTSFFGTLLITFTQEITYTDEITLRYFSLKHRDHPNVERKVVQIHYTGFPDFGRPQNTESFIKLLDFMEAYLKWVDTPPSKSKTNSSTSSGSTSAECDSKQQPILLHCSAGIGRTGTLIACHVAWQSLKARNFSINIKKLVKQLRKDRPGMVQSVEQYVFIHDVVARLKVLIRKKFNREENEEENLESDEEESSLDADDTWGEDLTDASMEIDEECTASYEDLGCRSVTVRN
eukprot:TRINITY_DN6037_c0_g1_i1.p1 TRINITY_DN6037_c0_g1~~TRINITY_DN6037_c0_g1_i1.p1  ORF type:complete len:361 (+),score=56.33 TRINITY_DN6037_c0_g1_i1:123-1205(+)